MSFGQQAITNEDLRVPGVEQDRPPIGNQTQLVFRSELESDDNYDLRADPIGQTTLWTNSLELSQSNRTPVDEFVGSVQASLRYSDIPEVGTDVEVDDYILVGEYTRTLDDFTLATGFRYRNVALDFFDPFSNISSSGEIIDTSGGGQFEGIAANITTQLNPKGPLRLEFSLNAVRDDYEDTTTNTDTDRVDGVAEAGFRINERIDGLVGFNGSYYEEPDNDEFVRTTDYYAGFSARVRPTTNVRVVVGYGRSEADRNDGGETTEEGLTFSATAEDTRPTGTYTAGLISSIGENGQTLSLRFGGERTLSDTRAINLIFGLSDGPDYGIAPFWVFGYSNRTRVANLSIVGSQRVTDNDDGDSSLVNNLSASYEHAINRLTFVNLRLLGGRTDTLETDNLQTDDFTEFQATASLRRQLTEDWSANVGVRHRSRFRDQEDDETSNAAFFNIERAFKTR